MSNSGTTNGAGSGRGASTHPFLSRADDSVGLLARITPHQGARGVALAEKTGRGWTRRAAGRGRRAFTRVELCACLVAGALLLTLALPTLANGRSRSHLAQCFNNLRQIGAGFQSWAMGHEEQFPWQARPSDGGVNNVGGGFPLASNPFIHFAVASNEFVTPRILVCPADAAKKVAANFSSTIADGGFLGVTYQNAAVSYIVGLHGQVDRPRSLLSGDRNIQTSRNKTCPVVNVPAATPDLLDARVGCTNGVHQLIGHVLFTDGSVETSDQDGLRATFEKMRTSSEQLSSDVVHLLIPGTPNVILP